MAFLSDSKSTPRSRVVVTLFKWENEMLMGKRNDESAGMSHCSRQSHDYLSNPLMLKLYFREFFQLHCAVKFMNMSISITLQVFRKSKDGM